MPTRRDRSSEVTGAGEGLVGVLTRRGEGEEGGEVGGRWPPVALPSGSQEPQRHAPRVVDAPALTKIRRAKDGNGPDPKLELLKDRSLVLQETRSPVGAQSNIKGSAAN